MTKYVIIPTLWTTHCQEIRLCLKMKQINVKDCCKTYLNNVESLFELRLLSGRMYLDFINFNLNQTCFSCEFQNLNVKYCRSYKLTYQTEQTRLVIPFKMHEVNEHTSSNQSCLHFSICSRRKTNAKVIRIRKVLLCKPRPFL